MKTNIESLVEEALSLTPEQIELAKSLTIQEGEG